MEKTTGKYSTNTYEYYKNMIDIEIGWLQFLTSFGRIKNTRSFDLEHQLELLKLEMLEGIEDFIDNNNTDESIENLSLIREYLEECLRKRHLDYVIPYVNYGLSDNDKNDLIVLMYVRKFVKSISSDLREIREVLRKINTSDIRAINTLIDNVTRLLPDVYLKSEEFGDSMMDFYASEVGVKFSHEGSGSAYIYMVLMLLDRINAYMCLMIPSEYEDTLIPVSDDIVAFDKQTYLENGANYNIRNLINAFDGLRNNITMFKKALSDLAKRNEEVQKRLAVES